MYLKLRHRLRVYTFAILIIPIVINIGFVFGGSKQGSCLQSSISNATANQSISCGSKFRLPRSNRSEVVRVIKELFSKPRDSSTEPPNKLRDAVNSLGFKVVEMQEAPDFNLIAVLPGKHWKTSKDKILLLGAHWDTQPDVPGVVDNGSGSTCIFEIARLLMGHQCNFSHTIMFVWFDREEQNKLGSEHFVRNYLYKEVLDKYGSQFIGAYLADMVMVSECQNDTQWLPDYLPISSPDFHSEIERESNRGDFLTLMSRTSDQHLVTAFQESWNKLGLEKRRLKSWQSKLPADRWPTEVELATWNLFTKSDQYSFWFPVNETTAVTSKKRSYADRNSLNAVLLNDLSLWRSSYQRCYHQRCDDLHLLTDENVTFMQMVIDTLVDLVLRIGDGCCYGRSERGARTNLQPSWQRWIG